jgi:protein-disulfide isomerase
MLGYLRNQMGEDLAHVYRHFPLENVHPHAVIAAEASEAAAAQGKFWEMHDIIFANQDALQPDDLLAYAEALDLDTDRFAEELASRLYRPRVEEDFAAGVRSGVNGTPTFFINGIRYDGVPDPQSLLEALSTAVQLHDSL